MDSCTREEQQGRYHGGHGASKEMLNRGCFVELGLDAHGVGEGETRAQGRRQEDLEGGSSHRWWPERPSEDQREEDEEPGPPRFLSRMRSLPARGRCSSVEEADELARSGLEIPEEAGQLSGRPLPPSTPRR